MAQVQIQYQSPIGGSGISPDGNHLLPTSLYVGDLDMGVTDSQLHDLFVQAGQVVSVRVCRDLATRGSLGYGYVNFRDPDDAARALGMLNLTRINGKPIRIMYSHRDPSLRKSGSGNVFIKNLDRDIDNGGLQETFSTFGNILSCKVATDAGGESKGYGFVQFDSEESAGKAIEKLNGMLLNDKQVFVGPFVGKQERDAASSSAEFSNVFVKNLLEATTEDDLNNIFGEFGPITSSVVMRNGEGKSRCFGFVNFERRDDAARAVDALNGKNFEDREWYVGKAQKKAERAMELKERFEKEAVDRYKGVNLYVKNIDDSITDEKLTELFSPFGAISSCKVVRGMNGMSRGSGFVAFSGPEDASRAIAEMNGKMVIGKPLYVAVAQRKEDRKARLKAQFSQRGMAAPAATAQSMYPAGQQMFYAQALPEVVPPQPGFGYHQQQHQHQQMMMGPSGPLMPNFFVPMVGRRGGAVPMHNQQHLMRRGYPVMPDPYMSGLDGGMSVPFRDASASLPPHVPPVRTLASALAGASPDQQRTILGENLYPLVEELEGDMAAKVTGMLLEMDQTEVLHLLESPESLKSKVTEAMDVLRSVAHQTNSVSDRLASLSLAA